MVRAPRGNVVRLRVLEFELEPQDACLYDALELWDGARGVFLGRSVSVFGFILSFDLNANGSTVLYSSGARATAGTAEARSRG